MISDGAGRAVQVGGFSPGGPLVISLSVASANQQLLPFTVYRLWSSVDCFFDLGTSNAVVATTSSHPLTAKLDVMHVTDATNIWLAGIVAAGTGILFLSPIRTGGV